VRRSFVLVSAVVAAVLALLLGLLAQAAGADPQPTCITGAITLQSPPSISGNTAVGGTLTVSTGSWSSCGERLSGYTYSWSGAGSSSTNSYVVQSGDAGATVSAAVSACNVDGCSTPAAASITIPPVTGGGGSSSGGGGGGCTPQSCPPPGPPKPSDRDGDGVADSSDNCPDLWNTDQGDADADHVGNACDTTVPSDFVNGTLSSDNGSERSYFVVDPGTLALLPCKNAWARYTYTNLVRLYVLWRYQLSFDFCYVPGSKIVRVTGLVAHGTYAAWPWSFQGNAVDPRLIVGPPGFAVHAFAQGKFAACVGIGVIGVCGGSRSPYLDLYASALPSTWFTGGLS
jgi:hypothetical protein